MSFVLLLFLERKTQFAQQRPVFIVIGGRSHDSALARMRASRRAVKTLLLDQGLVSGIGNIYADEGLWEARVHGLRPGTWLGPRVTDRLLDQLAAVMRRALAAGGTSFDALYVDAEGAAGYFARELATQ